MARKTRRGTEADDAVLMVDVAARSAIMHEAGTDILAKNFEALQYTDGFRSVEVSMMLSAWSSIRYVSRTEPAFTKRYSDACTVAGKTAWNVRFIRLAVYCSDAKGLTVWSL